MKKASTRPVTGKKNRWVPHTSPHTFEKVCIDMPEIESLPLEEARGRVTRWKTENVDMQPMNGFFIRYDDILGLVKSLHNNAQNGEIMGVRAYIGMHDFQSLKPEERYQASSIMFVGVEYAEGYPNGKDIILNAEGRSLIFDLTQPCPNCCDFTSPLNGILPKKKLALKDLAPVKKKQAAPKKKPAMKKKATAKKPK